MMSVFYQYLNYCEIQWMKYTQTSQAFVKKHYLLPVKKQTMKELKVLLGEGAEWVPEFIFCLPHASSTHLHINSLTVGDS